MVSMVGAAPCAVRAREAVKGLEAPPRAGDAGAGGTVREPVMDEYVPEERREPSGRYWLGRGEDGSPKVIFDSSERAADGPQRPEAGAPAEAAPRRGEESCRCSTDQVDREIEALKKEREALERQIGSQQDEGERAQMEKRLAQVDRELRQKDNDAYRRRHSAFT